MSLALFFINMNKNNKDLHTKIEIEGQPNLWIETLHSIMNNDQILEFFNLIYDKEHLNIVLTGAGSSAFIGESIEHLFRFRQGFTAKAIPTTTLVTHFNSYIDTSVPLLLISFARSGNSPESIATVDIAESQCEEVYHIALTCNQTGQLAQKIQELSNGLTILLPPDSEDKGLAMTGSFTSMILSAIYLSNHSKSENLLPLIEQIAEDTRKIIDTAAPALKEIAGKDFNRIVFLGSGPLLGIARESHLKVQELTDGIVVGKFDSFLGFRHGPKAVVNEKTLLVFLFSSDMNVFRYEKDLVEDILQDGIAMSCIGVFYNQLQADELPLNLNIICKNGTNFEPSAFDLLPYVVPAQILGFYKSLDLGLNPDSPSKNNAISRVVKGVTIYN